MLTADEVEIVDSSNSAVFQQQRKELNLLSQLGGKFVGAGGRLQTVSHFEKIMMDAFRQGLGRVYG
jgi:hypothetical protein